MKYIDKVEYSESSEFKVAKVYYPKELRKGVFLKLNQLVKKRLFVYNIEPCIGRIDGSVVLVCKDKTVLETVVTELCAYLEAMKGVTLYEGKFSDGKPDRIS